MPWTAKAQSTLPPSTPQVRPPCPALPCPDLHLPVARAKSRHDLRALTDFFFLQPALDNSSYNNRGLKRSRSPAEPADAGTSASNVALHFAPADDSDDLKPRKRGRPPKQKTADSPQMAAHPVHLSSPLAVQTPQIKQAASQSSPSQASPQRPTPGSGQKTAVVKALPTVRDHTTDQLGPEAWSHYPRAGLGQQLQDFGQGCQQLWWPGLLL